MTHGKYGWVPDPDPTSPRLHLASYIHYKKSSFLQELMDKLRRRPPHHIPKPAPPAPSGFAAPSALTWGPGLAYPIFGNDVYGDCVEAAMCHATQVDQFLISNDTITALTENTALTTYTDITGFNPAIPSTDQGTNIPAALNWWKANPLPGTNYQLAAWFQLPTEPGLNWQDAIYLCDGLIIGVNLPASAETQFDAGVPWTVVNGSPITDGHCILITGYDSTADTWHGLTWGGMVTITNLWMQTYVSEAYCVVSNLLAADPTLPDKLNTAQANADWFELTGEAGPFSGVA